jgi:hypothetical protein
VAKYNWDSAASESVGTSYSNNQSITAPEGVHTLYLWVKDQAGNTSTWSATYFTDTTPPSVQNQKTPPLTSEPNVTLDRTPDLSGLQGLWYKVGSAPTSPTDGYCSEPVLELLLDENSGTTAKDTSGFGNHATISGPTWAMGKLGAALSFDGVDDYVLTPNVRSLFSDESVTISVWFYPTAAGVVVAELGQSTINTGWHDSQIEVLSTGEVRARVWNLSSVSLGTASFNAWNHAVLRYDKAGLRLDGFLNGKRSASLVSGDRSAPWESGYGLYYALGTTDSTNLGDGTYFNGLIDEFRVYNRPLTDAEVLLLYYNRLSRPVGYWSFNEGSGGTAFDSSGRGLNGTLYNGPTWITGKSGSALSFDGVDDYVRAPMSFIPFKDEATIAAWVKPDTSDTVYGVGYEAESYDGDTGEDYQDGSAWVRRALVGTHPAGYLCANMNVPAGFNGPFALTTYSKVDNNSAAVVAWTVEVYENGALKWSYSRNANSYSSTTSYTWYESPTWVFDGSKSYTMKIYWPGNVGVYMDKLSLMARRRDWDVHKLHAVPETHRQHPAGGLVQQEERR